MLSTIRAGLAKFHDSKLVDELIEAYVEAKRNYYLETHPESPPGDCVREFLKEESSGLLN